MYVAAYYTRLKGLWDELASYNDLSPYSCGVMKKHLEHEERNALMQFLMGLHESYGAIHGQILLMQPLPNLQMAYSLISQEEKQRELSTSRGTMGVATMAIQSRGPNQHTRKSGRKPLHYSHCGRDYHTKETCYKIHGYPEGHRLHKPNRSKGDSTRKWTSSSANNVKTGLSMQKLQTAMPNLSQDQYQQIFSVMNEKAVKPETSQANTTGLLKSLGSK